MNEIKTQKHVRYLELIVLYSLTFVPVLILTICAFFLINGQEEGLRTPGFEALLLGAIVFAIPVSLNGWPAIVLNIFVFGILANSSKVERLLFHIVISTLTLPPAVCLIIIAKKLPEDWISMTLPYSIAIGVVMGFVMWWKRGYYLRTNKATREKEE